MGRRYRKGSYKARKAGIMPSRLYAKWEHEGKRQSFRVYGNATDTLTRPQQAYAKKGFEWLKYCERVVSGASPRPTSRKRKGSNLHAVASG